MHQVILDRLEEYLAGTPSSREFTAHLESCQECRTEVSEMQEISSAFVALRATVESAPPLGFYSRVARRVELQRPRSASSFFRLDPIFGKRVAFASLMTLAILGSYLVSRETEYSAGPPSPEVIMSQQAPAQDPDAMLATLAAYEP
jgi:anti-sigma factor RsiW